MKIFLSSTSQDLVSHREKAAQALERLGQQAVRMEVFGSRPVESTRACFEEIEGCDAIIGIYAHRYGYMPAGANRSITEQEFDYAGTRNKPIFCFIIDDDYPWLPRNIEEEPGRSKLQSFKNKIKSNLVFDPFTSPEDLAFKISSSIGRFLLTIKIKDELEKIPSVDKISTELGRSQVARRGARLRSILLGARILLVNDIPSEMTNVVQILRDLSLEVEVVTTTDDALGALSDGSFDAVISDMRRGSIEDEGLRFLKRMRERGLNRPVILTVGRYEPERGTPPYAFGITNRVDELLNLLFDALERTR